MQTRPAVATTAPPQWGDEDPYRPKLIGAKRALAAEAPWRIATDPRFPDTIVDAGLVGHLTVRAASTRGPSHRFYGATREDAAGVADIRGRFVAMAVADGVGSVPGSDRAAFTAIRVCLRHLHQHLATRTEVDEGDLREAVGDVHQTLLSQAELGGKPATTLTVAVVAAVPDVDGCYPLRIARVGDSPAYTLADGTFEEIFAVEAGDLHTTVTEGLPSPSLAPAVSVTGGRLRPGGALLLATDGLGTPMRFDDVRSYLVEAWRAPPEPLDFLTQLQFRRRSYDDDRSAAAIWAPPRVPAPAGTPARLATDCRFLRHDLLLPDSMLDAGQAGELEVRAASTRGPRHRRQGTTRHQAVGVVATAGGEQVVAALAESAHSVAGFHVGCQYAVQHVLGELRSLPADGPIGDEVVAALLHTAHQVSRFGAAAADKMTTLTVAVVAVRPGPDGQYAFTVVRVGYSPAYQLSEVVHQLFDGSGPEATTLLAGSRPPTDDTTRARSGRLAAGEALVLAAAGLDPAVRGGLGQRWHSAVPGPLEFLHMVRTPQPEEPAGEGDRSAVVIWAPRGER